MLVVLVNVRRKAGKPVPRGPRWDNRVHNSAQAKASGSGIRRTSRTRHYGVVPDLGTSGGRALREAS